MLLVVDSTIKSLIQVIKATVLEESNGEQDVAYLRTSMIPRIEIKGLRRFTIAQVDLVDYRLR